MRYYTFKDDFLLFTCILRTFAIDFQIEFTELYPLSFLEFLDAMEQDKLAKLLNPKIGN